MTIMEKIDIYSDVHLDSWSHIYNKMRPVDFYQKNPETEICIFAGDAGNGPRWYSENLRALRALYKRVISVPGNHCFYNSDFVSSGIVPLLTHNDPSNRFYELETNDGRKIKIATATFWTNFRKSRRYADVAENNISDFVAIPEMTTELMRKLHNDAKEHLSKIKSDGEIDIIVTHFPPIIQSEHPRFAGEILNAYFVNNEDEFFKQMKPKFWIHGHTHNKFDYVHDGVRVIANPIGYYGENSKEPRFFPITIEI